MALGLLSACSSDSKDGEVEGPDSAQSSFTSHSVPSFTSNGVEYVGQIKSLDQSGTKIESYLGIPFAQPPVNDKRWASPQRINSQASTFIADRFGPACMQGPHLANWYKGVIESFGGDPESFGSPEYSEDCLYLNIWRPDRELESAQRQPLPVYVFIHGGSNKGGWSYEPNYLGEMMAANDMVVVSIAYRLGVFGFFAHPELHQSNFGLLDQMAALQWIKDNIAALGGDPHRITVAGESAGANNIQYLMASPLAQGLFQRAIHASGGSPMVDNNSREALSQLGQKLAANLLAETTHSDDTQQLEKLKQLSAAEVQRATEVVYADHYFDVVVDDDSIFKAVGESAKQGELANVDLLLGTNANENLMYLDPQQSVNSWLDQNLPNASKEKIKQKLNPDKSELEQLDRLSTAYNFVCPSLMLADAVANNGGRVWAYEFTRVREGELAASMGAYHGAELPYVFNTHDDWLPTTTADRKLTEQMMTFWEHFIDTGSPNIEAENQVDWPAYKTARPLLMQLDTELIVREHGSRELCEILYPN